jgi:glyoxylase-like metal-dependent hydrolase (beta-lactamase superfamily II)
MLRIIDANGILPAKTCQIYGHQPNSKQELMACNRLLPLIFLLVAPAALAANTTEFCLDGKFNLGARYQGMEPGKDEFVKTRWCVITEDDSERAKFTGSGKSNPDMEGSWTVAMLPPDLVRIVNADDPPDIEFHGADSLAEARRVRRIDPLRLVMEHEQTPLEGVRVQITDGQLQAVAMSADMPLRGSVPVIWRWDWSRKKRPALKIEVDGDVVFEARGKWRELNDADAAQLWEATPGAEPVEVPGEHWPARVNMQRVDLAEGVHLVRGVRTGFQHLVVSTEKGLIIADAPAGWVELHQIPPTDLVPGLGISGLSENFIDFLAVEFPEQRIRAVALTHAHDDHAGGARAFAAARAVIYAPAGYTRFLETALNRDTMPIDRFTTVNGGIDVIPVSSAVTLSDSENTVRLVAIGAGPHASASLGVHVVEPGYFFVSDLHVPNSEDDTPRSDRAVTECWFADWAVANLPQETIVVNSHSAPQTPVSRLGKYLQSEACQRLRN